MTLPLNSRCQGLLGPSSTHPGHCGVPGAACSLKRGWQEAPRALSVGRCAVAGVIPLPRWKEEGARVSHGRGRSRLSRLRAGEAELLVGCRMFAWHIPQASREIHPWRLRAFPDSDWGFFSFLVFFRLFFIWGWVWGAVSYEWDWDTFCFSLCFLLWSWGAEVSDGWVCFRLPR